MSTTSHSRFSPEQLLKLPGGERHELAERTMSLELAWVTTLLCTKLNEFVLPRGLGFVVGGGTRFQFFDIAERICRPDISFIRSNVLKLDEFQSEYCAGMPHLVVRVVAPTDLFCDVEREAIEYSDAGIGLVWVINPDLETVLVYRPDHSMTRLTSSGTLDGEDVLPGFQCKVSSLFPDKSKLGLFTS